MLALGTSERQAIMTGLSSKSHWHLSRTLATQTGMTNDWLRRQGIATRVAAASARIRKQTLHTAEFRFSARGPQATTGRARVLLPAAPKAIQVTPEIPFEQAWDHPTSTLWLQWAHRAEDIQFMVEI